MSIYIPKKTSNSMWQAFRNKVRNKLGLHVYLNAKGKKKGNVLLSYLTQALTISPNEQWSTYHSSEWECFEIARIFSERGYKVDIINWDDDKFIPKKRYDFIIDTQRNLDRLSKHLDEKSVKINHIVSSYWEFQNDAEKKRLEGVFKRHGVILKPRRTELESKNIDIADLVSCLGNKTTKDTYSFSQKAIYEIPISSTIMFEQNPKRDFDVVKNNFLWFGGGGAVLKGLDLLLDTFKDTPDLNLTICGPVEHEEDFVELYKKELYHTANIHYLGRVDPKSSIFEKIVKNNTFIIYPSASEGQSGSVITCMHSGLIPILSRNSGIDIDEIGFELDTCNIEEIKSIIYKVSKIGVSRLKKLSDISCNFAQENFTPKTFTEAYSNFVDTVVLPFNKK